MKFFLGLTYIAENGQSHRPSTDNCPSSMTRTKLMCSQHWLLGALVGSQDLKEGTSKRRRKSFLSELEQI